MPKRRREEETAYVCETERGREHVRDIENERERNAEDKSESEIEKCVCGEKKTGTGGGHQGEQS